MNRVEEVVAGNIRRLRKERNVSLSELARASSVAKATLSSLETGTGNPTIQTLSALADALGCSLGDLLAENTPQLLRDGEGVWVEDTSTRGRLIARLFAQRGVDVHEVTFRAGKTHEAQPLSGTTEHMYVVSGEVEAGAPDAEVTLHPGDIIRFPADMAYVIRAVGEDARTLLFINAAESGPRNIAPSSATQRRKRARAAGATG